MPDHHPPTGEAPSLPKLTGRLTETAAPNEVAEVLDAVNTVSGSQIGILPQFTDLVATAANWARSRTDSEDPHHAPSRTVWEQLANAYHYLRTIEGLLARAQDHVACCAGDVVDPARRYGAVLPTRGLRADGPDVQAAGSGSDTERQQAALARSGSATGHAQTASGPATAATAPVPATPRPVGQTP
ncbi:hypothetical protein [Kitasatospora griseola]|uniref:hypothetical protein n=1 Tax=Kitasatospora griseola TaxID=2064 RepID=UPI0036479B09